jgi:hypothetical protein
MLTSGCIGLAKAAAKINLEIIYSFSSKMLSGGKADLPLTRQPMEYLG